MNQRTSDQSAINPESFSAPGMPPKQGLYDPWFEHEACGVGFVVDMHGRKSHQTVADGLQILRNLDHRGASGAEINTGDGAGILIQMPHKFFAEAAKASRITLPEAGQYGAGLIFLPRNPAVRRKVEEKFEEVVQAEGQVFLGWRTVPTSNASLGDTARSCEPFMRQAFIGRSPDLTDDLAFERKLYVIRKRSYTEIRTSTIRRCGILVCRLPLDAHARLQGHAHDRSGRSLLPRSEAPVDGVGDGARPFAFLDQHVSQLGARAPLPLPRAQRRDQHPPRQHRTG